MRTRSWSCLRIRARTPRWGRELDDRVLPAEAGLVERAVSLTKGCYPGQEPIARLHYRGHANRSLRLLEIETTEPPPYDAEVLRAGKAVGRVTSAVRDGDRIVALAYVRREVPEDAALEVGGAPRGYTSPLSAPVAQGIERCPAEAEVASSNLAGRMGGLVAGPQVAAVSGACVALREHGFAWLRSGGGAARDPRPEERIDEDGHHPRADERGADAGRDVASFRRDSHDRDDQRQPSGSEQPQRDRLSGRQLPGPRKRCAPRETTSRPRKSAASARPDAVRRLSRSKVIPVVTK